MTVCIVSIWFIMFPLIGAILIPSLVVYFINKKFKPKDKILSSIIIFIVLFMVLFIFLIWLFWPSCGGYIGWAY